MLLAACAAILAIQGIALLLRLPGLHLAPRGTPRWVGIVAIAAASFVASMALNGKGDTKTLLVGAGLGILASPFLACLRPLRTERWWLQGGRYPGHRFALRLVHLPEGTDALYASPGPEHASALGTTVVVFHGGGNDRLFGLHYLVEALCASGVSVLTANLPGHGQGYQDTFSLDACRRRLDACVKWAAERADGAVVVLGQSLGGAICLDALARGSALDGLVAVSAPHRLRVGGSCMGEVRGLLQHHIYRALRYANPFEALPAGGAFKRRQFPVRLEGDAPYVRSFEDAVDGMALCRELPKRPSPETPVLLIHGRRDGVIPVQQAEVLASSLGPTASVKLVKGMTHLDPLMRSDVVEQIVDWVARRRSVGRVGDRHRAPRGAE